MKKFLVIFLYILSANTFAESEQKFAVENNLDISKIKSDIDKYVNTLKMIADDYQKNGFYFKLEGKEIDRNKDGSYRLNISTSAFIRKEVVVRNFEKSKIFTSKLITKDALEVIRNSYLRGYNDKSTQKVNFIEKYFSYLCLVSRIKDGNGNLVKNPKNLEIKRSNYIFFNSFVDPNFKIDYVFPLYEMVKNGDIQISDTVVRYDVSLEELAKIKEISFSVEKCKYYNNSYRYVYE